MACKLSLQDFQKALRLNIQRSDPHCYPLLIRHCQRGKSTKAAKPQDPEIVSSMPVVEYAHEHAKLRNRLYCWGFAAYGGLGYAEFIKPYRKSERVEKMKRPFKLFFGDTHRVIDVACGNNFTVIAAKSDKTEHSVFGTGINTDSQIGYHCDEQGEPVIILAQPIPIQLPLNHRTTKVKRVACGRAHTVILTDEEGVFSLGNNSFGQCGRPVIEGEIYQNSLTVTKLANNLPADIVDICCGQDHTLFLTSSGEVYSCGWGADGQTGKAVSGQGHYNSCGIPQKVTGDIEGEKIVQVSGAVDCILAVSEKGELFGWGNSEYGQFGSITSSQQLNVSRHIPVAEVGKVKQASAGGTACTLVNDRGQVFVWGYGLLGQGPAVTQLSKPTLLPEPLFGKNEFNPDVKVLSVTCGIRHFAAITNTGSLYTWGKNKHCCLGLNIFEDQYFPFRVSITADVKKVSLGIEHSFAIATRHV